MRVVRFVFVTTLAAIAGVAHAQSTAASGSVIVLPVVAETVSYTSEVVVRNPNSALTLNVKFYEALTSTTPGLRTCSQLTVAASQSKPFSVSDQCNPLGAGNHHGMLVLEEPLRSRPICFSRFRVPRRPAATVSASKDFRSAHSPARLRT